MSTQTLNPLKMYTSDLIDPEAEIHYAVHKSIKNITIAHNHDFYEVFLLTKGSVVHIINGRRQILQAGAFVFIRPHDVHYYARHDGHACELINLAFPEQTAHELFDYLGHGFMADRLLNSTMPPSTVIPGVELNIVKSHLEGLNTIARTSKAEIRTRLRILLVELLSKYFPVRKHLQKRIIPDWLEWLVDEMQKRENFAEGISAMQRLARKSHEHLGRQFKKYLGVTPTQFVNELRLNYAANLLTNTDDTIMGVCLEAGFENLSHFYHLFKRHYGQSPKRFRLSHKRSGIPE